MNVSRLCDAAWQLFGIAPEFITESLGGAYAEIISSGETHSTGKMRLSHVLSLLRFALKCSRMASQSEVIFGETVRLCEDMRNRLRHPFSRFELADLIHKLQQMGA